MNSDVETLYELLPSIFRIRDAEQGEPLKALLSVIAEQVGVLDESMRQAYDDLFIETCAEWVVPYLGDLIGYESLYGVAPEISSPRREVAKTTGLRRRKGPAVTLEEVAFAVTGWKSRVVEFFELLSTTQYMNHIRLHSRQSPDFRRWESLERLDTAFDQVAHTLDVRRVDARRSRGGHNIRNVGIHLWRLKDYSLTRSPAARHDSRRWFFSPLGNNAPLFTRAESETEIPQLAKPINVPEPISRRVLHERLDQYYGQDKSILLTVNGDPVDISRVRACNLVDVEAGNWAHQNSDHFGIDPELGRIVTPQNQPPPDELLVTFHYGFSANMGGGEYASSDSFDTLQHEVEQVADGNSIQSALDLLINGGAVEIADSGRYEQTVAINAPAARGIELRSANGNRATLILQNDLELSGGEDSEITLNGLIIAGGTLRVSASNDNQLHRLRLRHCTLVPGIELDSNGEPLNGQQASLIVESPNVTIEIESSIIGSIQVSDSSVVRVSNSIVDATRETAVAYRGLAPDEPGGELEVSNSTIIGKVHAQSLPMVTNSIFAARLLETDEWTAPIRAAQKQIGCIRFSYVPPGSRVPRRFRCQPDLSIGMAIELARKSLGKEPTETEKDLIRADVRARLQPVFLETRYGRPNYLQLALQPAKIRTGADDEAEMGAFHELFQPQRETNLRIRLEEYLRFGLEAGIFYST